MPAFATAVGAIRDPQSLLDPGPRRAGEVAAGRRLHERRQRARPGDRLQHQPQVLGGARDGTGDLQIVPHPVARMRGHEPHRRPDPQHAAERRGDAQRSAQIGTLAQGDHAGRERGAAAARRSARTERRIPRVPRAAEDFVEGVAPSGELGRVGLAEDHRARGAQPLHHERVLGGDVVLVERRPERRAQALDRRDVLDADRQPAQEAGRFTLLEPPLELPGVVAGALVEGDNGVESRVVFLQPIETRLQYFDRGDFPRADEFRQLGGGPVRQRHGLAQSPTNATARQNAASPPLNFHGKHPRITRLFCSSGASISPPRFSMCTQSFGNSALCVSW